MKPSKLPFELETREILVKRKSKSDAKFGVEPDKRPAEELVQYGIVTLNKPKGPTSHQVSAYVQRILNIDKAGHSGTLDPAVTGVLPVTLGRATRIVEYLLTAGKEYVALMHLHGDVAEGKIYNVLNEFIGKVKQLPPIRSAVKRQWRTREIYYLDILEINGRDVLFRMGCQAGTYVRKWIHDFGQKLGVGAHMAELVRTQAGPFKAKNMATLQDLEDAVWYWKNGNEKLLRHCIKPPEQGVAHLPKLWVLDSAVESLCHGALLSAPGISQIETGIETGDVVAMLTLKGELICCGIARHTSEEMLAADKGVMVKPTKVLMLPGTYPRMAKE
ncbi:RNA-guided pseudouridylation complex pseudouridine synthase subunit Cbf5 [Candidatus Woesearchaeota archaeon]|nr:RNA-guided pseudouridylation complex pseudouridine synthase subunit Cbf5 [Candidatus Woesearchaeota archaeon]